MVHVLQEAPSPKILVTTALVMRMETQICVPKWTVMQVTLIKHVVRNNINIKN